MVGRPPRARLLPFLSLSRPSPIHQPQLVVYYALFFTEPYLGCIPM